MRRDRFDRRQHLRLRLADRQAADRVAVEADRGQRARALDPEVGLDAALDDAEDRPPRLGAERRLRALRPAQRQPHRALGLVARARQADAFVELHLDVGAEQALDLHRPLRRQFVARAVDMRLEDDAALVELAQLGEAHHLEAAGIGEDRMRPVHELVQAAELGDALGARRQHQMIGVGEHDVGAERAHLAGIHRLDRRRGADRHEGGRADRPARRRDRPDARGAVDGVNGKGEGVGHRAEAFGRAARKAPRSKHGGRRESNQRARPEQQAGVAVGIEAIALRRSRGRRRASSSRGR